jgi:hypothetical protein
MIQCQVSGCTSTFKSLKGARTHLTRVHASESNLEQANVQLSNNVLNLCNFCSKTFANKYCLQRHLGQCKNKQLTEQKIQLEKEHASALALYEKDKQLISQSKELEKHQSVVEIQAQHIEDLKKIVHEVKPSIVNNNNTTNIHNNSNNNMSRNNYTQNNTLNSSRQQIESLVPITTQALTAMVEETFKKYLDNRVISVSYEDLCNIWLNKTLKDSVIVTDTSRGVTHWKDGDKNNRTIKDTKCQLLSEKLQQAIKPDLNVLNNYSMFLNKNVDDLKTTDVDACVKSIETQLVITSLKSQNKEMIKDLGPTFTKLARSFIDPADNLSENKKKFDKFVKLVEATYSSNIQDIITKPPQDIAQNLISKLLPALQRTESCFTLTNESKQSVQLNAEQLLDFIKYCIVEAFDYPTNQLLIFAVAVQTPRSKEETMKNFQQFSDWLSFDRHKERTNDKEQLTYQQICEYEHSLLCCL